MIDYSTWAEKKEAVTSLSLDPENPRIPLAGEGQELQQRDLIAELVAHDDVLDLAQQIAQKGYAPIESLIGLKSDDGRKIILEGNRRLAALKLLLSPEVAPSSAVKRARSIAKGVDKSALRTVRVLYAPDRLSAAHLIMQKHTTGQVARWSPIMQARFFKRLVDSGLTPTRIASEYGSTSSDITDSLRLFEVYEMALGTNLPESVKSVIDDPRKFEISALERLIKAPSARKVLGIDFDGAHVVGRVPKEEFEKVLSKLLTDIVAKRLTTRKINKHDQMSLYLSDIKPYLPDKEKKGSFTVNDFRAASSTGPSAAAKATAAPAKRTTTKKPSVSIIPGGVSCTVNNSRIQAIFKELRALRLDKHPNTSGVLFRIILELSLGYYLEKTGRMKPLIDAAKAKGKPDFYPTLRQMLAHFMKDPVLPLDTLAKKKVNTLISASDSPLSVDGLDQYIHNRYASPSIDDLRGYWDTFESLLRLTLMEPAVQPKKAN